VLGDCNCGAIFARAALIAIAAAIDDATPRPRFESSAAHSMCVE